MALYAAAREARAKLAELRRQYVDGKFDPITKRKVEDLLERAHAGVEKREAMTLSDEDVAAVYGASDSILTELNEAVYVGERSDGDIGYSELIENLRDAGVDVSRYHGMDEPAGADEPPGPDADVSEDPEQPEMPAEPEIPEAVDTGEESEPAAVAESGEATPSDESEALAEPGESIDDLVTLAEAVLGDHYRGLSEPEPHDEPADHAPANESSEPAGTEVAAEAEPEAEQEPDAREELETVKEPEEQPDSELGALDQQLAESLDGVAGLSEEEWRETFTVLIAPTGYSADDWVSPHGPSDDGPDAPEVPETLEEPDPPEAPADTAEAEDTEAPRGTQGRREGCIILPGEPDVEPPAGPEAEPEPEVAEEPAATEAPAVAEAPAEVEVVEDAADDAKSPMAEAGLEVESVVDDETEVAAAVVDTPADDPDDLDVDTPADDLDDLDDDFDI